MPENIEEVKSVSGEKKENHELCIKAGATAGEIMRCVVDTVKKTGKAGEAVAKFGDKCTEVTSKGCRSLCERMGNLKNSLNKNKELAEWENKQKDIYAKIGEIIFKEKELNKVEPSEGIIEKKEVEVLLKTAYAFEKEIQKIKDEMALRKQEAETIEIIKRAEKDLKNEDPRVRRVALKVLERVGSKGNILPIVTVALRDSDLEVRERSARIMHTFADSYGGKKKAQEETIGKVQVIEKKIARKTTVKKTAALEVEKTENPVSAEVPGKTRSTEMIREIANKLKGEEEIEK